MGKVATFRGPEVGKHSSHTTNWYTAQYTNKAVLHEHTVEFSKST
jgi:hypothetical protein